MPRCKPCLAQEPTHRDVVVLQLLVQHLDGHLASEPRLFSAIYATVATSADSLPQNELTQRTPTQIELWHSSACTLHWGAPVSRLEAAGARDGTGTLLDTTYLSYLIVTAAGRVVLRVRTPAAWRDEMLPSSPAISVVAGPYSGTRSIVGDSMSELHRRRPTSVGDAPTPSGLLCCRWVRPEIPGYGAAAKPIAATSEKTTKM